MSAASAVADGAELLHLRQQIETELERVLELPSSGAVARAMRHAVLGGGTRLRPLITLGVARVAGADMSLALRAAAAVELIHCASLVVDDLPCMDNELTRRGSPATHVKFGVPIAILSAIALVSLAGRCIFQVHCPRRFEDKRVEFENELLAAIDDSGLIEGQALDLALQNGAMHVSRREVNELKTVPLFRSAVRAGFVFSDASDNVKKTLDQFGGRFGRAYQLLDDLIDGEDGRSDDFGAEIDYAYDCLRRVYGDTSILQTVLGLLDAKANSCCR